MSSNADLICSASSSGSTIALCTSDGVIKFYDTLTANLKLEYSSSSHLQATCSCLSWSKKKKNKAPLAKSKKTKTSNDAASSIENELNDLDLIAIGTSQGVILLYSLTKAALHSEFVFDVFKLWLATLNKINNKWFEFKTSLKMDMRIK